MSETNSTDILLNALKDITRNQYGMQSIIEEHNDVNAFNYHAMEYHRRQVESYRSIAFKALEAFKNSVDEFSDKELFDRLAYESWQLRPINVPSGGDDYLIHWQVMENQGECEPLLEVGSAYCDDPREAIRDAIRNRKQVTQPAECAS